MTHLPEQLEVLRERGVRELAADVRVTVGLGTCGRAAGAADVYEAIEHALQDVGAASRMALDAVGCRGLCYAEPLVEVSLASGEHFAFGPVDAQKGAAIARHFAADPRADLPPALAELVVGPDVLERQERRVMSNCGAIDPCSLAQYLARGGYAALTEALGRDPEELVGMVEQANLRGRGGAGFPAGTKWRALLQSGSAQRYFIVNGDEGDPGAYMDRGLMESDPHRVLEGLVIACYATGVHEAFFFVRAEYPLAVQTLRRAIDDAADAGILGDDVLGSGFALRVHIVRGAGAFLCGESTALVNVLENKECTTRPKPPHLTERGLWGAPTCINNVETLANVPLVVEKGADWFASVGTAASPGTKIFSITGAVARGGLVEVPLGISLGAVVHDIAAAPHAHAVQVGGPSGAILPAALADLEISYEGLTGVNGMMGSGGFVVIGQDQCVVDTAAYLVRFSAGQSCRKCKPCRDGLDECADILERLTRGEAAPDDLERLEQIAERNCASKLCGLGRTSLNPVLSSLRYFRDEYEAHLQKRCPGLACRALVSYEIVPERCQGERCCLLTCPGNAVKGPFGKPGRIVTRLCQRCGMCAVTCPYGAVKKVSPAQ